MTTHHAVDGRCVADGESWPCSACGQFIPVAITTHVAPAASDPHHAEPNHCAVCSLELPAGYMRHATCDPRWLQPPSGATGVDMRTVQMNGRIENGPDDKSAPGSANSPGT